MVWKEQWRDGAAEANHREGEHRSLKTNWAGASHHKVDTSHWRHTGQRPTTVKVDTHHWRHISYWVWESKKRIDQSRVLWTGHEESDFLQGTCCWIRESTNVMSQDRLQICLISGKTPWYKWGLNSSWDKSIYYPHWQEPHFPILSYYPLS